MAIIRIEQLYPFPHEEFRGRNRALSTSQEISSGARKSLETRAPGIASSITCFRHKRPDQVLGYALRPSSASPAAGYLAKHNLQQKELVAAAFREKI